jgi:ribosomal-protein-serine acetyltransferase
MSEAENNSIDNPENQFIYLKCEEQKHFFILNGKRVLMRPFKAEDEKYLYKVFKQDVEHLRHWLFSGIDDDEVSVEFTKNMLSNHINYWSAAYEYHYVLIDIESISILGSVSIHTIDYDNKYASIGYWMSNNSISKGSCHMFAAFIAHKAFAELLMNRVEFLIAYDNIKSLKCVQKLPVYTEGLMRRRLKVKENVYDAFVFSLLAEDIPALQKIYSSILPID